MRELILKKIVELVNYEKIINRDALRMEVKVALAKDGYSFTNINEVDDCIDQTVSEDLIVEALLALEENYSQDEFEAIYFSRNVKDIHFFLNIDGVEDYKVFHVSDGEGEEGGAEI